MSEISCPAATFCNILDFAMQHGSICGSMPKKRCISMPWKSAADGLARGRIAAVVLSLQL
jgi:hypothetical protein